VGWDVTRADTDELEELLLRLPSEVDSNTIIRTHQNPDLHPTWPIRTPAARCWSWAAPPTPRADCRGRYLSRAMHRAPSHRGGALPPLRFVHPRHNAPTRPFHLRINQLLPRCWRRGLASSAGSVRLRPIVDQLALIKQQVDPHTQNLSQLVICRAGGAGRARPPSVHAQVRATVAGVDAMVAGRCGQHVALPGNFRFSVPDGGMYLWCEPAAADDFRRADRAGPCASGESVMPADRRSLLRRSGRRPPAAHLLPRRSRPAAPCRSRKRLARSLGRRRPLDRRRARPPRCAWV